MAERSYKLRADVVEALRLKRGLTIHELAEAADVDRKTLQRWLKGQPAHVKNIFMLARALESTAQTLMEGFAPTFDGVKPVSQSGLSMTFTVEDENPATPDDIMLLCELLADAVLKYRRYKSGDATDPRAGFGPGGFEVDAFERDGVAYYYVSTKWLTTEPGAGMPEDGLVVEVSKGPVDKQKLERLRENFAEAIYQSMKTGQRRYTRGEQEG